MTDTNEQQAVAVRELTPIASLTQAYLETVRGFEVTDEDSCAQLADLRKTIQQAERKAKAKKASVKKPLADVVKAIDELFKPTLSDLANALQISKDKLDDYARVQFQIEAERRRIENEEARRREAEAKRQAEELRAAGAVETAELVERQAEANVVNTAKLAKPEAVRGQTSTVTTVRKWRGTVVDIKALCKAIGEGRMPTTMVTVSQSSIDAFARDREREGTEDGVKVFLDVTTQTR